MPAFLHSLFCIDLLIPLFLVHLFALMAFPLQLQKFFIQDRCIGLFVPDAVAVQSAYQKGGIPFPYWSQVWPAAIGLSQFLLNHSRYTLNKKVLELAAGLGLPSIVAAATAHSVICSDYLREAVEVISRSAMHNKLENLSVAVLNWHSLPQDIEADVLLLSDINYDPVVFAVQQKLITRFLQKEVICILSTPQRLIAKEFIAPLLSFCKHQEEIIVHHEEKEVIVTVFVLATL
jgi:predicted nicotinamide N-methyase